MKIFGSALVASLFIFQIHHSLAEDEGYRFRNGKCVNDEGKEGLNWNYRGQCGDWKKRNGLKRSNFSGLDLSGSRFNETELQEVDFTGAILQKVDFSKSNLSGASFFGAKIRNSDFSQTALSRSNFAESVIESSIFRRSDAKHVDFSLAILSNVVFALAEMDSSVFTETKMKEMSFESVRCELCNFKGAEISDSNFGSSKFRNSDFSDSKLSKVGASHSNFFRATFANSTIHSLSFVGAKMKSVNFYSARVSDSNFYAAYLFMSDWNQSTIQGSSFEFAKLHNVNLSESDLSDVTWKKAVADQDTRFSFSEREARKLGIQIDSEFALDHWILSSVLTAENESSSIKSGLKRDRNLEFRAFHDFKSENLDGLQFARSITMPAVYHRDGVIEKALLDEESVKTIREWTKDGGRFIIPAGYYDYNTRFLKIFFEEDIEVTERVLARGGIQLNNVARDISSLRDVEEQVMSHCVSSFDLVGESLPKKALRLYESKGNGSVVEFSYGDGRVYYFAWTFFTGSNYCSGPERRKWFDLLFKAINS